MNYCLNKQSLHLFLDHINNQSKLPIDDDDLALIIEGATIWEHEVSIVTYFFTTYLQKKINSNNFDELEISSYFKLRDIGNYRVQSFDRDFIDYLFCYSRSRMRMNLEEVIIKVQLDLSENNYASNFRY